MTHKRSEVDDILEFIMVYMSSTIGFYLSTIGVTLLGLGFYISSFDIWVLSPYVWDTPQCGHPGEAEEAIDLHDGEAIEVEPWSFI